VKLFSSKAVAIGAGMALAWGVTACGGQANARPVSDLNIGYFTVGSANTYAKILNDATMSAARARGAKITQLDSNFDVQTQINQMQQALARKTYNAWIVTLADGVQQCNQVKAAIDAGIPVMVSVGHLCKDAEVGQVGFVGVQTRKTYDTWWKTILDQNPEGKVAFLAGPPLVDLVQSNKAAMEEAFKQHPDAKMVYYQNTDWTAQDSYEKTQSLLKSHTDVTAIASSSAEATRGILQAVKQAGLTGKVKIYDMMGDQFIVDQIKAGVVTLSQPALPASEGKSAAENLINHWTGKPTYTVYNPADDAPIKDGPFITRKNADSYTAEIPS
jgi:ribose transport system substrate-binding protein